MERFVLLMLVAHFRKLLDTETEEAERRIVQKMLAEAEAELARLELAGQAVTDAGSARSAAPDASLWKIAGSGGEVAG